MFIGIGNFIGNRQGGGALPEELIAGYQEDFVEVTSESYVASDFTPADTTAEVWLNPDAITAANIPNSDDVLDSVPNSGTGADFSQATLANRPTWKQHIAGPYFEPVISGSYDLSADTWYKYKRKSVWFDTGDFLRLTPPVQDPTYFDLFLTILPRAGANQIVWSHRSEATRLFQLQFTQATKKYHFMLRSSGNSLKTIISTSVADMVTPDIVRITFDKAGNLHSISVNDETPVTDTTNFGTETFTSTRWTLGGFTQDGTAYSSGPQMYVGDVIMKYSAFTAQEVSDIKNFLQNRTYRWQLDA